MLGELLGSELREQFPLLYRAPDDAAHDCVRLPERNAAANEHVSDVSRREELI